MRMYRKRRGLVPRKLYTLRGWRIQWVQRHEEVIPKSVLRQLRNAATDAAKWQQHVANTKAADQGLSTTVFEKVRSLVAQLEEQDAVIQHLRNQLEEYRNGQAEPSNLPRQLR